jgi:hypothetical protein
MIVNISSENIKANSKNNYSYTQYLRGPSGIPNGYDIEAIKFKNISPAIYEIHINIGGGAVLLKYDKDEFDNIKLPEYGILASKCPFHTIAIQYKVDNAYIQHNSVYEEEDEMEVVEEEEEYEITIRTADGELHTGRPVRITERPTGRKIMSVIDTPDIQIPEVELSLKEGRPTTGRIVAAFTQKLTIDPSKMPLPYIDKLINEHYFLAKISGERDFNIYNAVRENRIIPGTVRNHIQYSHGLAGMTQHFI